MSQLAVATFEPAQVLQYDHARSNVVRLTIAQALAGANSVVVYATGAIAGNMLGVPKATRRDKQLQTEFRALTRRLGKTSVFVTHDLDEAIRIGDRIAIMKDGRIVQIGTPEAIVLQPADAYVAEFTEGISRLPLVTARTIMRAPEAGAEALPQVTPDTTLEAIIDRALHQQAQAVAVSEGGRILGQLSRDDILRAVRGSGQRATEGA